MDTIQQLEQQILTQLQAADQPLHIDQITGALTADLRPGDSADMRMTASVIADHHPKIGATIDDRYFLYTTSVQAFVIELLERMERPAHYRAVTSRFNDWVKPRSRKGAGYILDVLNSTVRCNRVDRGIYTLSNDTP